MKQGAKMMEGILCSLLPHAYNSVKENRQKYNNNHNNNKTHTTEKRGKKQVKN